MVLKALLSAVSPQGEGARLSVFILHRVLAAQDPIFPDEMHARRFDEWCSWIKAWFNVLPLDVAAARLQVGSLPARSACITFDDGYADNHDIAAPILHKHGMPATFFIATGFLDGGRMWNDTVIEAVRGARAAVLDLGSLGQFGLGSSAERMAAIGGIIGKIKYLPIPERLAAAQEVAYAAQVSPPDDLMMSSAQVKTMRRLGMQIGAHTVSHPILATLDDAQARAEIKGSKDCLELLLGERIGLFAYPNGKPGDDYVPQNVEVVRSLGFDAAVSTCWGASRLGDDILQIKRFTPWDRSKLRFALRTLQNLRRS